MNSINIINPINYEGWDKLLLTNDRTTFFHTAAWARVLSESYNYKPLYFTIIEDGKLNALIPIMEIKSILTGNRGVSLPFTDECTSIASDDHHFKSVIDALIQYGKEAGWKHFELRGNHDYLNESPNSSTFYAHSLDLSQGEEKLFYGFRESTRRNIKRAQKEGVKVKLCHSLDAMKSFYRLNCITRKLHGLPPQPLSFFMKIHDHVISAKKGLVVIAAYKSRLVAGAVYFLFDTDVVYKYGASDKEYQHLRSNNLVMWEVMKWCCRNGFKHFSFGRSETENQGLLQFKRGWGAEEGVIKYYKYDLAKDGFISEKPKIKSSYNFFKMMPLPILRVTGSLLYRHVG